jgi:hypothetical protein
MQGAFSAGRLAAATLAACVVATLAPDAFADADPASDVLIGQNIYFPYDTKLSPEAKTGLTTTVAKLNRKGYRLKVAIIAQEFDLGGIPSFYGKPKQYVRFLGIELAGLFKGRLLVVMPQGFGFYHGKTPTTKAYRALQKIPIDGSTDGLVTAATGAVKKLGTMKT